MGEEGSSNVIRTGQGLAMMPDPSVLTREALARELAQLRELLRAEISGETAAIVARLDGMDRAIVVFTDNLTRVPTDVDKQVSNLDRLTEQKFGTVDEKFRTVSELFKGIQVQFNERDVRVLESAAAATTAVNAALQAAKEAVGAQNASFTLGIDKSEKATLEQINQQRVLLEKTGESLDEKINDLKDRMTRAESMGLGRTAAVVDQRASAGEIRGYIATAVGLVLVLLAILGYFATH